MHLLREFFGQLIADCQESWMTDYGIRNKMTVADIETVLTVMDIYRCSQI